MIEARHVGGINVRNVKNKNGWAICNELAPKFPVFIAFAMEVVTLTWHPIVDNSMLIIIVTPSDLFCFRICRYVSQGPGANVESFTDDNFRII